MISPTLSARAHLKLKMCLAFAVAVIMALNMPSAVDAQGLVKGVQQGAQAGNRAAGPVGGVLGGAQSPNQKLAIGNVLDSWPREPRQRV